MIPAPRPQSPSLPAPLAWPTARRLQKDRIGAVILSCLALAPCAAALVWMTRAAPEDRDGPAAFLALTLLLPAALGPVVRALVDRRGRGLVLTALRGGPDAEVEIRARSGAGGGLVVPLRGRGSLGRVYRVGLKRMAVAEALAQTAAGEVLFARGGTALDPDLVRWIGEVVASPGLSRSRSESPHVEEIAARAARAPLDAPAPIEPVRDRGWPAWRYRAAEPRGVGLAAALLAVLMAWLILFPRLGVFPLAVMATWIVPVSLLLVWSILLAGPLTVDLEVRGPMLIFRRRRFGVTLWTSVNDARQAGLDVSQLPFVALRCAGRLRGFTTPAVGGPDVAAMAWLSAAIRSSALRGAPGP